MLVTELPMVTEVRPVHALNADSPMLVTLSGMVREVMPVQPVNAYLPMLVTELPMVTEVRPVHCWNADSPMLVTESGMVTEVMPVHPRYWLSSIVWPVMVRCPVGHAAEAAEAIPSWMLMRTSAVAVADCMFVLSSC